MVHPNFVKLCKYCNKAINGGFGGHYFTEHVEKCQLFSQFVVYESDGSPRCTKCHRNFKNQQGLYGHLARVHFPDRFKKLTCLTCSNRYDDKSKHVELCRKYFKNVKFVDNRWRCQFPKCTKFCDTQNGIYLHIKRMHEMKDRRPLNTLNYNNDDIRLPRSPRLRVRGDLTESQNQANCVSRETSAMVNQQVEKALNETRRYVNLPGSQGLNNGVPRVTNVNQHVVNQALEDTRLLMDSVEENIGPYQEALAPGVPSSSRSTTRVTSVTTNTTTSRGYANPDENSYEPLDPPRARAPQPSPVQAPPEPAIQEVFTSPQQNNNGEDSDSDIEFLEEVPAKQPLEKRPINTVQSDSNSENNQEVQSEYKEEDHRMESKGFIGAVLKLFVCNFCDTSFSDQAFAISHMKRYHKIPKDFQNCMKIKHL